MASSLYNTGTVAVTNGSKVVTGTGTGWYPTDIRNSDIVRISGSAELYFVDTVDSPTQITLDRNFTGSTASGLTYTIVRMAGDWGTARILGLEVAEYVRTFRTGQLFEWIIALSYEDAEFSAQTGVITVRVPKDITVSELNLFLNDPSTSGNVVADIRINGTSVLSTKLTVNQDEITSDAVGTTPYVLTNPNWAKGDVLSVDFLTVGLGATGAKLTISGQRSF